MPSSVRIKVNQKNVRALLVAPEVMADLQRRAEAIARAADSAANDPGGHRVTPPEEGRRRGRVAVVTATPKAMFKEATVKSLTGSVGAGRR